MSLKRSIGSLILFSLGACRPGTVAVGPDQAMVVPPAIGLSAQRAEAVSTKEGAPVSELTAVALVDDVRLVRPVNGPVLLVDGRNRTIYETTPDGVVRPFAPFGTYIAEHVQPYLYLDRIVGVWPATLAIELVYAARTAAYAESFAVDLAHGKLKPLGRKSTMTAAMPWKEGRTLAFATADGQLSQFSGGKFYVAGGPPAAVPVLPPRAVTGGDFVAYASGVVILPATVFPPDGSDAEVEEGTIFVYADGVHPSRQKLPGTVNGITRGRVAEETLVHGDGYLRRYDPAGWVDVPMPSTEDLRSISVDDEGTAWLVMAGKLYRGAFPALAWTPVVLPADYVATDVAATTSKDVWVMGEKGGVLHRGPAPAGAPVTLASDQDAFVGMVTKGQEPHAFFDGCQIPLVVLGDAAERTESEAESATAGLLPFEARFERGQLGASTVDALVPASAEPQENATLRRYLPKLAKQFPHVRLACGRTVPKAPATP